MALAKKWSRKGHLAMNKIVTREYTINTHKCIQRVAFKKCAPGVLKWIQKSAMKKMETPDVHTDTSLSKAVWPKGISNVSHHVHLLLVRKCNEHEESHQLYTLVSHVPLTTLKNLQLMWMRTNQ
ncbi:large ribosomal subunit protein eL31-like [Bos javanicus]|uniref:large ribosomal subunit protein eL31-like n=1 Tax=Bos javanicus TaxID=9906 RepID=UPI002AA81D57|nr:large ribosomal subunit protein eL31-like [Bos javanicus]